MTYKEILRHLELKQPFTFIRWGDGEFNCMFPTFPKLTNTDGHSYFPKLSKELRELLIRESKQQKYVHGLQPKAKREFPEVSFFNVEWSNADLFVHESLKGNLKLKSYLSESLIVGSSQVGKLGKHKVVVPASNAYLQFESIFEEVKDKAHHVDIIFLSCGMMAGILADKLHQEFKDLTIIDIGSALDPYVGKNTRGYHQQIIQSKFTL